MFFFYHSATRLLHPRVAKRVAVTTCGSERNTAPPCFVVALYHVCTCRRTPFCTHRVSVVRRLRTRECAVSIAVGTARVWLRCRRTVNPSTLHYHPFLTPLPLITFFLHEINGSFQLLTRFSYLVTCTFKHKFPPFFVITCRSRFQRCLPLPFPPPLSQRPPVRPNPFPTTRNTRC